MINQPSEFLKIHKIISSRNLNESFKLLRSKASSVADHKLFDKVVSLEETYNYMINYFVNGYEDAGRENMLEQIINELHSLADLLHRESLIDDSISPYFAQIRTDRLSNISLEERIDKYGSAHEERLLVETSGSYDQDIAKNEEIALADLFLKIWISDPLSKSERNNIEHILLQSDDYILKCQIISAMMLGGMQYFDSSKLDILLTVYNSCFDSVSIKARSLTAAIAIILSHIDRVRDSKDIFKKIDSQDFGIIFLNFIRTRETDSITDKMNNDVIPELMKLQPKIVKRFKDASKEIDINDLESNPEWEEIIDKSGINDTMRELTEMQSEGSDVMMFAFSNLKRFRFFNNIYNWFLPYNPNHSELSKLRDMNISALDTMLTSTDFLCDSDKYSFVLSILAVPEAQRQAMTSQLNMQFSQSKSDIDDRRLTTPRGDFKIEVVKYVRDIYRFMRLYSHKEFFNDLFSMELDENLLSCINEKLMESDSYILLGEFLFKKKFYSEAILVFTDLARSNSESHILEKLGFCYQSQGLISRALEYYKRAEITNPDNLWLLKRIASCSKNAGNYVDAISYYKRILDKEPENISMIMNLGHSLLEIGEIDEALQLYYKVDYLSPNRSNVLRSIAWSEMMRGNDDKSRNYYEKIVITDPTSTDWLNFGHLALLKGDIKEAIGYYKQYLNNDKNGVYKLEQEIKDDLAQLYVSRSLYTQKNGFSIEDLPLLLDKIRYELN